MPDIMLQVSLQELCEQEGITETMVVAVVEHGITQPLAGDEFNEWVFESSSVHWMKKAIRLYHDLELDWVSVAMLIDLLQQRDDLQRENERLKIQLDRFVNNKI